MHSCLYEFFRDQGSLIAGVLALIAGGLAYRAGLVQATETRKAAAMQVDAARRRDDREVDALRKSLATELRQVVPRALGAHHSLKDLVKKTDTPITARMVENLSFVPAPVVYIASAPKIGLLESDATDVMIIYNLLEIAREGANRLMRHRTPDDINPMLVAAVAEAFLCTCKYAQGVLPRLKTGVPFHDDRDKVLVEEIGDAARSN